MGSRSDSMCFKHGEEIIAMLREGFRPFKIAESLGAKQEAVFMAINRYYAKLGIPADDSYDRNVLFVLREQPLRKEIEDLRKQLAEERCPFPDLHCPHQGRHR